MKENELRSPPSPCCVNCEEPIVRHPMGRWVHAATRTTWCMPERQGYDQPKATAPTVCEERVKSGTRRGELCGRNARFRDVDRNLDLCGRHTPVASGNRIVELKEGS